MNRKYKFTYDYWSEYHFKNLEKITRRLSTCKLNHPIEILEIGTYEGRTGIKLLESVPRSHLTIIEPHPSENLYHNYEYWFSINRASLIEKPSSEALVDLRGNLFDLIYIDGDNNSCSVIEDAILSWRLLHIEGVMVFNDYLLEINSREFYESHKEFETHKKDGLMFHHPKEAIDAFLTIYKGQYKVYVGNYQVGLIKTCEIK